MSAELLLEHFDRISCAPDAVARLRRFILDLAVRGKLVEQDVADEPAQTLLVRIGAMKVRAIKEGVARKEKPLPPLGDDLPFPLPTNWSWSQLCEIGFVNPRNSAADDVQASFVPMSLIPAEYGVPHTHEIRPWGEIKSGFSHFAEGDVGLAKITPCFENGKSTVFRRLAGGIGAGTTELHVLRPIIVSPDYLLIFLKSPYFLQSGMPRMTGTAGQKRVPTDYFAHTPFPLPPLAEQRRIVAKVEELMVLCDRLGAAQRERENRRDYLTASTHHHLNNGTDVDTLRRHTQFLIRHLPRLTDRPGQIEQLRQAILSLAVRGILVQQQPTDHSAAALLTTNDELRRATAKTDRRSDAYRQELLVRHLMWGIPSSWKWTALADAFLFIDYRGKTPKKTPRGVRLITAKNVRKGYIDISPEEFISESEYDSWMTRGLPENRDILFTTEAPLGNAAVVKLRERFALAQRVICFRPYGGIDPEFLSIQIRSEQFQSMLNELATGLTAKGIKAAKLKRVPVAVPPLAEQLRIVNKVNAFMALCDQLEGKLITATTEANRLLESLLHNALHASTEPELTLA